ncbi:Golgi apparatus protein 1 isoform X2 [Agrilus planipennis]|uniref:Golgi apparatus protein 1 isoform X2 n=1 Tax=Agrilus planipennis TaxID=224129 RepID=A0A1W4WSH8_AGRPL|nr:Golgi apparatus protein 1 isoform X2 [Agrilus planipennis]
MRAIISFYIIGLSANVFSNVIESGVNNSNSIVHQGRFKRGSKNTIFDDGNCSILKEMCKNVADDDILILECVQNLKINHLVKLNEKCQNIIWSHTLQVLNNSYINDILTSVCRGQWSNCDNNDKKPLSVLKCAIKKKEDITSPECVNTIERFENLAFSDFRWISSFLEHCVNDISALECGRVDPSGFSQADTLICLQNKISSVSSVCQAEVYKLAEIQSDNIKFDRTLYVACAEDHMKYCSEFVPGSGRVFKCLIQHQHDKLSDMCRNQLLRREKLISEDYRVSKGLMKACKEDIRKSHCRKQDQDKHTRLAQVLLCLENYAHNGTRIDPDCEIEMANHRRMLMDDYRLSPEIVTSCSDEIHKFCSGLETGGRTIHCLMDHARLRNIRRKISDTCERALEDLVKETDAGEDWRVDPVLHEACIPVVRIACKDIRGGNARVMSCLMDTLGTDQMTEECENALMQIQYFVARDFKLDPQLYTACREDAAAFCHAKKEWEKTDSYDPSNGRIILPCLYRYAYSPQKDMQLKPKCLEQIRRVMRQRAVSVDLQPEIEEVCLEDLSLYCFDKTKKGEEIKCLQDNLDDLQQACRISVFNFTKIEAEHAEVNPYIMTYCRKAIEIHCAAEFKHDEGDVMECLFAHKNDPVVKSNPKCRVNIEHFQILTLKDYHFSYKFKVACKSDAMRFCRDAKTKSAVVVCLSEKYRNDTLNGIKSNIKKECRQQLKAQLFQIRENINFDPHLKAACEKDISRYCSNVDAGSGQILECLQAVEEKLTDTCHKEVFKVKMQELTDNAVDYVLLTTCADTIDRFCPRTDKEFVLECLKRHKDELEFGKKCYTIVTRRTKEQFSDFRLNPSLQENCHQDMNTHCFDVLSLAKPDQELNGAMIKCLKVAFRQSRLTDLCAKEVTNILREQALNIELNPLLRVLCKHELSTICKNHESAEECLKNALLQHKVPTLECQNEVANLIEVSQADIHVDPLLQKACALDILKLCSEVPQGGGRHIKCLKTFMSDLTFECRNMLTKRLEMYKSAEGVFPIDGLQGLYSQVAVSPAKNYLFMVMFMVIGSFFIAGLFCGRVSNKRKISKNK